MDAVAAYYDWIHSLGDLFLGELEYELRKDFRKRFKDFGWNVGLNREAALHSEAMMHRGEVYSAPKEYLGWALKEFVKKGFADYKESDLSRAIGEFVKEGFVDCEAISQYQWSIEQTLKQIAHEILASPEACQALAAYPLIGVGIALQDLKYMNTVLLYVTVRLGR